MFHGICGRSKGNATAMDNCYKQEKFSLVYLDRANVAYNEIVYWPSGE